MIFGNSKIAQFLIFFLMILATLVLMKYSRRPKDAIMKVAIFVLPFQGGYWIKSIDLEFNFSIFFIIILFFCNPGDEKTKGK